MKVYTSWFDNSGYLKEQGFACTGICRYPPDKFKDNNLYIIAPSIEILHKFKNHEITSEQFKYMYLSQLRNTNIADIGNAIRNVSEKYGNADVVLCCYENPELFCHRHILAEWMNSIGMFDGDIHEWTAKDKKFNSIELF